MHDKHVTNKILLFKQQQQQKTCSREKSEELKHTIFFD